MDPRIIVVGSSNTDLIAYVERTPKIGETILGHKFSTGFGGKGANQAVMAARLTEKEGDVCMVTKIGKDLYGRETMKNYQDQRMNCKYIFETEEASTGVAPIIVDSEGRNSIVVVPGANMLLTPEEIETARPMIKNAKVLICQLEISVKTTIAALRIGREEGICTILNTAPAPKEFDPDLFKYADIVSPNESEAELITGMTINDVESATVASKKILEMGAKMVVMTLGEKGSLLVTPDAVEHVACPKVKAIDTVGAGDSFIGALGYFIAEEYSLPEAMKRACQIASVSVQAEGTQTSYPQRKDLDPALFVKSD